MGKRIHWTVSRQTIRDNVTGMLLTFEHDRDGRPVLHLVARGQSRFATFTFADGKWNRRTTVHSFTPDEPDERGHE